MADGPSPFSLWLEEALSGWILPVAAIAVVAGVGVLYVAGLASESVTATLVIAAVSIGVAVFVARPALDAKRDAASRAVAGAAALATLLAAGWPALRSVEPGEPLFAGELAQAGDAMPIGGGATGAVRLLVSGRLAERGEPSVSFTLTGARDPVDGKLERTFGYARVGRGGRARVSHDHTSDFYDAQLLPGARELKLDRLAGQLGGALAVEAFRPPLPMPWGPWLAAGAALVLASLAEARLGRKNDLSVATGMAAAFGLLVTFNATPTAAVGPAVGGVVLGALTGALVGWVVGAIVRRLVPPVARRDTRRPKGAEAA